MDTATRAKQALSGDGARAIGYSDEHRPLGGYALLAGAFNAAFAAALVAGSGASTRSSSSTRG